MHAGAEEICHYGGARAGDATIHRGRDFVWIFARNCVGAEQLQFMYEI